MMSILIKDIEMPKNCGICGFKDGCEFSMPLTERPFDCPLVEVPVDYDELLKAAKAMHTWIFLHSGDEEMAYKACKLSDEMNALLGYSGSFTVIPADKDGET